MMRAWKWKMAGVGMCCALGLAGCAESDEPDEGTMRLDLNGDVPSDAAVEVSIDGQYVEVKGTPMAAHEAAHVVQQKLSVKQKEECLAAQSKKTGTLPEHCRPADRGLYIVGLDRDPKTGDGEVKVMAVNNHNTTRSTRTHVTAPPEDGHGGAGTPPLQLDARVFDVDGDGVEDLAVGLGRAGNVEVSIAFGSERTNPKTKEKETVFGNPVTLLDDQLSGAAIHSLRTYGGKYGTLAGVSRRVCDVAVASLKQQPAGDDRQSYRKRVSLRINSKITAGRPSLENTGVGAAPAVPTRLKNGDVAWWVAADGQLRRHVPGTGDPKNDFGRYSDLKRVIQADSTWTSDGLLTMASTYGDVRLRSREEAKRD